MSKATILIVEDEAIIAADLAMQLKRLDYAVGGIAGSGAEGLAQIRQTVPDLVLMDIQLGGSLDGIQVAEIIREQHGVPVIYLTAHSDAATLSRAKLTEPFGYILKPYAERELDTQIGIALYRNASEIRLRESEARFQSLFRHSLDLIFAVNRDGRLVMSNPALATTSGYTSQELGERTFLDLCDSASRERTQAALQEALTEKSSEIECRILHRDGHPVDLLLSSSPMFVRGNVEGVSGVARDTTERKRLTNRLASFFELSPDLMCVAGFDGYFKRLSPSWEQTLGYQRGELMAHPWLHFVHPEDQAATIAAGHDLTNDQKIVSFVNRYRHADGSYRWLEWHCFPDTEESLINCVARDITKRKKIEHAREHHLLHLSHLLGLATALLEETDLSALMQRTVDVAEKVTGAQFGICGHGFRNGVFEVGASSRTTGRQPCPPGTAFKVQRGTVYCELLNDHSVIRYRQRDLLEHPDWRGLPKGHGPLNGLLGARLSGRDGKPIGLVMVSDKAEGEFTMEDEALLAQVAALASLGIQHLTTRDEAQKRANQLHAVFDAMVEVVMIYDRKGIPREVNPATLMVCGFDPRGMTRSELIRRLHIRHPDGRRYKVKELPCSVALQGGFSGGRRMLVRDGAKTERVLISSSSPLFLRNEVIGAVCVWHDVTEREQLLAELEQRVEARTASLNQAIHELQEEMATRKETEEALRESEERFRSMFESHAAAMLLINPKSGSIEDANPSAERLYGYSKERFSTLNLKDLEVRGMPGESPKEPLVAAYLGGVTRGLHRQSSGQTRPVEAYSSMVEIGGRPFLFSIVHDVTERKELEQQILKIGDQERQRLGRDLHDSLGGSLTGIAMMSQSLANGLSQKGLAQATVAQEIVGAVNQAIAQSRVIAQGLCPIGLGSQGLPSGLEDYAKGISQHRGLNCQFKGDRKIELKDESMISHLYRIVQEAVTNAIRHGKAKNILIELKRQGNGLRLRIEDDGTGLPSTPKTSHGMGLRTMQYRAEIVGARLEISSPPKGGVAVTCYLPDKST